MSSLLGGAVMFFFHCLFDGLVFNRRTLAATALYAMKLTVSLLLKNTIDLLFFSEHKLYGFPQSGDIRSPWL